MKKSVQLCNIAVFCTILGGLLAGNLLSPDQEFSANENRYLTQMPKFTMKSLFDHSFSNKFEEYLNDQFIFRDQWVEGKTAVERLMGKTENNGVYFGKDETLIEKLKPVDMKQVEKNMQSINQLADKINVPVRMMLIPGASQIYQDKLPMFADEINQLELINKTETMASDKIQFINVNDDFLSHGDEDIYFRTDHHFNIYGAEIAYEALMNAQGIEVQKYQTETVSTEFLGTLASQSGSYSIQPDEIIKLIQNKPISVDFSDVDETFEDVYFDENLEVKDKYTYYLNGNHPLVHIKTSAEGKGNILILRDSYGNIFTPYLLNEYENIYLFDLRYNKTEVSKFVEENNIDEVLVFYSAKNFMSETNFAFLR